MTFFESIRTVIRKYSDFTGTASRSEFWWWMLFDILVLAALGFIDPTTVGDNGTISGGVLGSVRGKAGGYYLSRDPGEVTLCDVVTRFEGTAGMLACASGRPGCSCEFSKEESLCKIRASFADIHRKMTEMLSGVTLRDLV